jgi:hypothetical protein
MHQAVHQLGYFNNNSMPLVIPVLLFGLPMVSLLSGYGHDVQKQGRAEA